MDGNEPISFEGCFAGDVSELSDDVLSQMNNAIIIYLTRLEDRRQEVCQERMHRVQSQIEATQ